MLFDLEIHSGQDGEAGPKIFRHVDWMRSSTTREGVLRHLKVNDFCRLVANHRCLVWINNELWPEQNFEQKIIRMGDYVRVAVPAPHGQSLTATRRFLQIAEDQARDHIMFESSDSYPASEDYEQAEQDESGSTQYGPRSSISEPEPHAEVRFEHLDVLDPLLAARNGDGRAGRTVALHFLCGIHVGARWCRTKKPLTRRCVEKLLNNTVRRLGASVECKVHPILPQPWVHNLFALHLLVAIQSRYCNN